VLPQLDLDAEYAYYDGTLYLLDPGPVAFWYDAGEGWRYFRVHAEIEGESVDIWPSEEEWHSMVSVSAPEAQRLVRAWAAGLDAKPCSYVSPYA
jgi:hypothetical protein